MAEYIERDAAYPLAKKICDAIDSKEFQRLNFGMLILDWIDDIPTADVRPVVRGMWTKELHPNVRYNQYKCSVCGKFSGHDEEGWIWKPNFCPNCGADMRGEQDV